ncbi:bacteriocin [bacterium]|nr:MAG: bacteriocin [bacterium]
MKELSIEEMEQISGGETNINWDGVACVGFGVGLSAAAGAVAGPWGAALMGFAYGSLAYCPPVTYDNTRCATIGGYC